MPRKNHTRPALWKLLPAGALLIGAVSLASAPKSPYTQNHRAYYANPKTVNFIRPGLVVTVKAAAIAADGTITARVQFADPKGMPLDKDGIQTPGVISASAVAAYIPQGQSQYVAYTVRSQTSTITGVTVNQAGTDSGGKWTKVSDGLYDYTFKTKAPAGYQAGATHAVGVYASRDLTEFDFGTALDDSVFPFVPDGSAQPVTRDVIRTQSCQRCHNDTFAFHGNTGRTSVQMCVLCHTPQSVDPDTGNSVDMAVMIHKIHMGKNLPTVQAGGKYQIIGHGGSVADYSNVSFPTDLRNCTVCHEQTTGAAQAQNYLAKPTMAACGSCHDNVSFASGQNHNNGLAQVDNSQCSTCHVANSGKEFDASITGAHVIEELSQASTPGPLDLQIVDITNTAPGQKPVLTFTVKDRSGNPIQPSTLDRLAGIIGGPTTDYTASFAGQTATPGYVTEDMRAKATGSNGTYTYTFNNAIPANASGTYAITLSGRGVAMVNGIEIEWGVAKNPVSYFSVDGSPVVPRRTVVAVEKCQSCHFSLVMHGSNRANSIEHCVVCHNPVQTDAGTRPAGAGKPESLDFRQMIHGIHSGEWAKTTANSPDYIVYGKGGKSDYSEVVYPGRLASCDYCHVNGSQNLPLAPTVAQAVNNPNGILNPSGPEAAACLSCHRSQDAAAHAQQMTSSVLGESCSVCHGANADASVGKVHAAASTPVGSE